MVAIVLTMRILVGILMNRIRGPREWNIVRHAR